MVKLDGPEKYIRAVEGPCACAGPVTAKASSRANDFKNTRVAPNLKAEHEVNFKCPQWVESGHSPVAVAFLEWRH